jgi:hypothetical protein
MHRFLAVGGGLQHSCRDFPFLILPKEALIYSASTQKELTDARGFFKTSFGRIFCSTKNRAFRGFRPAALRRDRSAPLQSLARIPIPQGVDIITLINNLATDFALISFR